jgi:hypothetical protein
MNLTLNEQLMRDTGDAHICIFIANLATWLRFNASKTDPDKRNYHENRFWSYNSLADFVKYFGFWSTRQMRTIIKNCIDEGLIITNTFNKKKYDNTTWYSLTDKGLEYYPALRDITLNTLVENDKTLVENDNAIPEDTTHSSNNTITTNSSSTSKSKGKNLNIMREMIDAYREEFPDNPQPHKSVISTSLEKSLRSLIKRWPEADPQGKPFDIVGFKRYLYGLKTLSPKFSLGEYETKDGNKKKNGMETFCRWNTFVKFLEGQYS